VALRTRALITTAADSGLRVSECCSLDTAQLRANSNGQVKFASSFYLRANQAKGGAAGAGQVELSERARAAIGAYVKAAVAAHWMLWPPAESAPLFLGHRGYQGERGHERLSIRAAQHSWHELQQRAGLSSRYPFHALRHDAASRWRRAGADLFTLMRQMRWRDADTAQRYVHEIDAAVRAPKVARRVAHTD
jgi:integrase